MIRVRPEPKLGSGRIGSMATSLIPLGMRSWEMLPAAASRCRFDADSHSG